MQSGSTLLTQQRLDLTMTRLCHQLIENHGDFSDSCIVGIQSRGALLSDRLVEKLREQKIQEPLSASETTIDFLVEDKRVILVDDVLYTGRTVQSALTALQHFGRPSKVELLVLVDRRFNRQLPLRADYTGVRVDAVDEAYVKVMWRDVEGMDEVKIFSSKT